MEIRIKRGEEEYGPYTEAEARAYLGEGRLVAEDLASADGADWRPLGELLEVPAATVAPVPPAPGRYPPAGPGARFGAALLDIILAVVFLVPGMLAWGGTFASDFGDREIFMLAGGALTGLGYLLLKDGFDGRSLGKRATGLMVVHLPSNRPCGIGLSIVRMLVVLFANVLPGIGWLIEPILVIVTSDRRRLGDRAASTQVIRVADYRP